MPCRCDYLEPTRREVEMQRAANLQVYLLQKLGKAVPDWLQRQAESMYADDERNVVDLCALLRGMDENLREKIVYNVHDRVARDLANWWEDHQEADRRREAEEAAERQRAEAAKRGLAKLSAAERDALGL